MGWAPYVPERLRRWARSIRAMISSWCFPLSRWKHSLQPAKGYHRGPGLVQATLGLEHGCLRRLPIQPKRVAGRIIPIEQPRTQLPCRPSYLHGRPWQGRVSHCWAVVIRLPSSPRPAHACIGHDGVPGHADGDAVCDGGPGEVFRPAGANACRPDCVRWRVASVGRGKPRSVMGTTARCESERSKSLWLPGPDSHRARNRGASGRRPLALGAPPHHTLKIPRHPEISLASLEPLVPTRTPQNGRYGPDRHILPQSVARGS